MGKGKAGGAKMRTGTAYSAGSRGTGMNGKQSSNAPKKAPQIIEGSNKSSIGPRRSGRGR